MITGDQFNLLPSGLSSPASLKSERVEVKRACVSIIVSCIVVNFPFLDGDVPSSPSYGVYISHVDDFNTRNKCLTAKLLKQGYRYHVKKGFF